MLRTGTNEKNVNTFQIYLECEDDRNYCKKNTKNTKTFRVELKLDVFTGQHLFFIVVLI